MESPHPRRCGTFSARDLPWLGIAGVTLGLGGGLWMALNAFGCQQASTEVKGSHSEASTHSRKMSLTVEDALPVPAPAPQPVAPAPKGRWVVHYDDPPEKK